jgi:hypothetical protein
MLIAPNRPADEDHCDHRIGQDHPVRLRLAVGLTLSLKVGMLLAAAWVYANRAALSEACQAEERLHRAQGLERAFANSVEGLTPQPDMRDHAAPEQNKLLYACPVGPGPFLLERRLYADAGATLERSNALAVCTGVAPAVDRLRAQAAPDAQRPGAYA